MGDWTMQQALGSSTLDLISATIHGHLHWFQGLVFENQALPVEIVVGNGGTKLERAYMASTTSVEGLNVNGVRVERAFTRERDRHREPRGFGLMMLRWVPLLSRGALPECMFLRGSRRSSRKPLQGFDAASTGRRHAV